MNTVLIVTFSLLGAAGLLCILRLLRPSSVADRAIALDTLLWVVAAGLGVFLLEGGGEYFLDLLIVASLLGFVGTVTVARFIERRGT